MNQATRSAKRHAPAAPASTPARPAPLRLYPSGDWATAGIWDTRRPPYRCGTCGAVDVLQCGCLDRLAPSAGAGGAE